MKGVLLASSGARLHPASAAVAKHLLPVGGKPLIYYPLSVLMLAGVRYIRIVASAFELPQVREALGDGSRLGMRFNYSTPRAGDGDVFTTSADHIGDDPVALVLGDNLFHGHAFSEVLRECGAGVNGCRLFSYQVDDFGGNGSAGVGGGEAGLATRITGLYFYDDEVLTLAEHVRARCSWPGIADVNEAYHERGRSTVTRLGRGFAWLDIDTPADVLQASRYVHTLERRLGARIACIEEIALRMGFIDREVCHRLGDELAGSSYGRYVVAVAERSTGVGGATVGPAQPVQVAAAEDRPS